MIRRLAVAALLIPLVLGVIFWAPLWVYLLLLEAFLLAGVWELMSLARRFGADTYPVTYPLAALFPLLWVYAGSWLGWHAIASGLIVFVWCLFSSKDLETSFPSAAINLTAIVYLGIPFAVAAAYHPRFSSHGYDRVRGFEVLLILVTIWASDGGAYFAGKAFGKRRISPVLSPNKSLEGYLSGILSAALAAMLVGSWLIPQKGIFYWGVVGLVLGAAGILGDLFESMLKRGAGVKDTSRLIPGHGGVLDRIDSLLFALPAYFLLSGLLE